MSPKVLMLPPENPLFLKQRAEAEVNATWQRWFKNGAPLRATLHSARD